MSSRLWQMPLTHYGLGEGMELVQDEEGRGSYSVDLEAWAL